MKKVFFLIVSMLFVVACLSGGLTQPTSAPVGAPPTTVENITNPTTAPPAGGENPTQPADSAPTLASATKEKSKATAAAAPIAIGDISVYVPDTWTSTVVEVKPVKGIIFANRLPSDFTAQEKTAEAFPSGFASGGVVLSPIPGTANSKTLFAGMMENLSKYTSDDFQSMLTAEDQVGLIDLASIESVSLNSARAGELSRSQALVMDGTLKYPDGKGTVQAQVWLSWEGSNFITFYRFASEGVSADDNQELENIRASIKIPTN
jgi:hypothetical protein